MTQQSHSQANTQRKPKLKKDAGIPLFSVALFTIARKWKQPRCPSTDEWIKKFWSVCTQWNITQSLKKLMHLSQF